MADNMSQILTSPDKKENETYGVGGVLARLYRRILANLNINGGVWNALMFDYLSNPDNRIPTNQKDRTSIRGNIIRELARPQMTWKVFFKGLRFIQVVEFDITVGLKLRNGKRIEVQLPTYEIGSKQHEDESILGMGLDLDEDDEDTEIDEVAKEAAFSKLNKIKRK